MQQNKTNESDYESQTSRDHNQYIIVYISNDISILKTFQGHCLLAYVAA
jgi:hypothetical protein